MQTVNPHTDPRTTTGVVIRPLTASDRELLSDAFSRLSEDTRLRRFHGLAKRLSEHGLDRLTHLDHPRNEALAEIAVAADDAILYTIPLDSFSNRRRAAT